VAVDAKICGVTRPEDAAFAAAAGAWRIGVIFAGGPRQVTTTQAAAIVAAAAPVPVLGVFGPRPLATMLQEVAAAGLAGVQLHGEHPAAVAATLRAHGLEVWRVVPIGRGMDLAATMTAGARDVSAVLLEAARPGGGGGKGIPIPLELAREARQGGRTVRVVLAGGLTPDSVTRAIEVVGPDAVDVSSGIESSPGIKDHRLIARFLEQVRGARTPS
jgi:phosphoribosylanthranilate isomerase